MSDAEPSPPRSLEGEDFSGATVWGVSFADAEFEDVNFTGATMRRIWLRNVTIDGFVENLVVNGVDVTAAVNAGDTWWPLRGMLRPVSGPEYREVWSTLCARWDETIAAFESEGPDATTVSVAGEWSLRDTLRHLIFVTDKWLFAPLTAASTFAWLGKSNTGSKDFPWPGVDAAANPTWAETLQEYRHRCRRVTDFLDRFDPATVPAEVEVLENGTVPGIECCYAVFEEEFEHLRYAVRDLAVLRHFGH